MWSVKVCVFVVWKNDLCLNPRGFDEPMLHPPRVVIVVCRVHTTNSACAIRALHWSDRSCRVSSLGKTLVGFGVL